MLWEIYGGLMIDNYDENHVFITDTFHLQVHWIISEFRRTLGFNLNDKILSSAVFVKNQNEKETNLIVVLFSSLNYILGDYKRSVPMKILGPSLSQLYRSMLMNMGGYNKVERLTLLRHQMFPIHLFH